ncbi:MAG: hypothetical protein LBL76_10310, partial [Treponema sp.]|nr:hypothetical protein [Treponema sp.]
ETLDEEIDYSIIIFEPHFTIKNESSHKQRVELTSVFIDPNGILNTEWTKSLQLNAGKEDNLKISITCPQNVPIILSFLLVINGKNYAGWAVDSVNLDINRLEYGLGYVAIEPDGTFPPLLTSTLEPEIRKDGSRDNIAFYTVTITDEGVLFVLDKQIDGSAPSF